MSYFFAQRMTYCQALVPSEIAWDVFDRLGQQSKVALDSRQLNYDNPFVRSYRRCEQLLTKTAAIRVMLAKCKNWISFQLKEVRDEAATWRGFRDLISEKKIEGYLYINHIEEEVLTTHAFLYGQMHQIDGFAKRVGQLVIQMGLLVTLDRLGGLQMLRGGEMPGQAFSGMGDIGGERSNMFESRCVGISRKELLMLKRSVFRITRGNSWVNQLQISMQDVNRYFTSSKHRKLAAEALKDQVACIIVFPKGELGTVMNKIDRLLTCLNCHVLPQERGSIQQELQRMEKKIGDIETMEDLTFQGIRKHIRRLSTVRQGSTGSWLSEMQLYGKKEREIYRALSATDVSRAMVRFRLYIPSKELPLTIQPKKNLPPLILNVVESSRMPPSKFDTNCMLTVPQEIVNTYGVPSYLEINPAPFYIVTFAFFIGVMFGDIGHMLLAIALLVYFKANLWFWMIIFFMGYCGLIYNQFFGLNLGLFASCYSVTAEGLPADGSADCVYPIGVDSIWKVATNEMSFTNSLKMKVAVILGVVHMMLGLCLRTYNNVRQKRWADLLLLTLPQIVFMCCTFVYMDFIIIYKWNSTYPNTSTAPSVISTMISVFVNMATPSPSDLLFWPTERKFERAVVVIALLCVPVMLLGKPIAICCKRRKEKIDSPDHVELEELAEQQQEVEMQEVMDDRLSNDELKHSSVKHEEVSHEQESIKEIMVHQFIETIEFVLGSVSNTASYLRLWALSLAHAQLSSVIFQLTMLKQMEKGYSGLVGLFLLFPFYLAVTFGVMICMDSLECFLHSLRLHWVEFQNKFYQGKGYLFEPFTFKKMK